MPFDFKAMSLLIDDMDSTEDDMTTLKLVFGLFGKELDTLERRIEELEHDANQFYRILDLERRE